MDCKKGPDSDKQAFTAWIRELHAAFQPDGLLLSAAVSPSFKVIDAGQFKFNYLVKLIIYEN